MNDNSKKNQGPIIAEWETLDTLVDYKDLIGKNVIGVRVTVDRPIFENGNTGYKRVNAELRFAGHFIRLNTKGFVNLLKVLDDHRDAISEAVDKAHDDNDEKRRKQNERRGIRDTDDSSTTPQTKPGGVGGGLSRFARTSKSDRKTQKRERSREPQES